MHARFSYRPGTKPAGLVKSCGNEVSGGERGRQSLAAAPQGQDQLGISLSNIRMQPRVPATVANRWEELFAGWQPNRAGFVAETSQDTPTVVRGSQSLQGVDAGPSLAAGVLCRDGRRPGMQVEPASGSGNERRRRRVSLLSPRDHTPSSANDPKLG